ncbi:SRPBCC family protein [Dyadobacter frigoris]|uniref:Polyketide cyclase n=1 Tax=Dyadobacter frigoris TaxID=2576211 RepID=A0A4U6CNY1_9BACT|nr:SRPBCC family protein [Dyadobacter frigoris]TKT85295.1 polyketide cyclase [Dyadobacter frigoris]GLU54753.1 activator of HSP90 ATPase [Dyadobacter frigoris]
MASETIIVEATIEAPIEKVWETWTKPEHIMHWNNASDDWFTPKAENDLRPGGKFSSRMEARDGSFGFDFEGIYDEVTDHKLISYSLEDGRKVKIEFEEKGDQTLVTENFDAETENPVEMQKAGWQSILNNFKKYTEGL